MKKNLPKLVLVSSVIRRDLHQPLRFFRGLRVFHLYHQAAYGDMKKEDFYRPRAIQYHSAGNLYQHLRALKPDILQTAEPWANRLSFMITLVCWWYSLFHSVKIIFPVFENRPLNEKFFWPKASFIAWWAMILARRTSLILYMNQGARKNLLVIGIPEKKLMRARWATWGIDLAEFKPAVQDIEQKLTQPTILFVGKISPAKGVPWLIQAFGQVREVLPQARLWLAGPIEDGGLVETIKKIPGARYLGIIKNQDLPVYLRKAALVATPSITTQSWEEQVGMVNLQAMACATPVVSTRSGAIPEYIRSGQGCFLVPEKNSQELAHAILKFLKNSRFYLTQSRRAHHFVSTHYEVRQNIHHLEKLLLELLVPQPVKGSDPK